MFPGGKYESREMGQPGTDIKDPHYTMPFEYLDAKNWAKYPSLNKVIDDMNSKGADRWVAVLKQTDGNKSMPYVLMNWLTFSEMLSFYLWQSQANRERQEEECPRCAEAFKDCMEYKGEQEDHVMSDLDMTAAARRDGRGYSEEE